MRASLVRLDCNPRELQTCRASNPSGLCADIVGNVTRPPLAQLTPDACGVQSENRPTKVRSAGEPTVGSCQSVQIFRQGPDSWPLPGHQFEFEFRFGRLYSRSDQGKLARLQQMQQTIRINGIVERNVESGKAKLRPIDERWPRRISEGVTRNAVFAPLSRWHFVA